MEQPKINDKFLPLAEYKKVCAELLVLAERFGHSVDITAYSCIADAAKYFTQYIAEEEAAIRIAAQ